MRRLKRIGFRSGIVAGSILSLVMIGVPAYLLAQSYLQPVQGGGLIFQSMNPVVRYAGAIKAQDLSGTDAGPVNVGMTQDAIFCGQLANNGTVYVSPVTGYPSGAAYSGNGMSYAIAGNGCDAEDSGTEATADEIMWSSNALKVLGMSCKVSSSGSNGVVLTMRSATADLSPSVTVTIPTGSTTGVADVQTYTDIAAGATVAVKAVDTEDLSAQDVWCVAKIVVVP